MLTIHFDRVQQHATFGSFRMHGDDAYFDICRLLTDRGWWDEPATFVDERGMACLTTNSLHACAARYRPNEGDTRRRRSGSGFWPAGRSGGGGQQHDRAIRTDPHRQSVHPNDG